MRADASSSEVAPDGSPVAFYRRLPAAGEPELIHGLMAPGTSILDLGCGTGRIFRARLLEDAALRTLLAEGGLAFGRWLHRPGWFTAQHMR